MYVFWSNNAALLLLVLGVTMGMTLVSSNINVSVIGRLRSTYTCKPKTFNGGDAQSGRYWLLLEEHDIGSQCHPVDEFCY